MIHPIIKNLWDSYLEVTPTVEKVKAILRLKKYNSFCDHIAFRTVALQDESSNNNYGIEALSIPFLKLGYQIKNTYSFTKKKLNAIHLEKDNLPRIFISELLISQCSSFAQHTLLNTLDNATTSKNILTSGRQWKVNFATYKKLVNESEYAAWFYIHGHRVNHFTINVNQLQNYSLEKICQQLLNYGVSLNTSGGIIKGSEMVGLKQASTIADKVPVKFEDLKSSIKIRSCYVEFAERFIINDKIFNGFITNSADKIFQSTNRKTA